MRCHFVARRWKTEHESLRDIDFQMGRARLAARGTTLKSTTLTRPETRSIVPSAGPARRPFSAWAGPIQGGSKAARPQARSGPACQLHPRVPRPASSEPLDRRVPAVGSARG
jgi:hypothetical protein